MRKAALLADFNLATRAAMRAQCWAICQPCWQYIY